ncbi:hypothetical protein L0Z72_00405, partial [candidate division KSB1 bacterium]|nr:hypothetical protein [candidate division KSB1 bacterium]
IHSILALSQFDEVYHHIFEKAVNQFVTIYESKSIPLCIYDSERNVNLNKLRYPPHYSGLDLLNVICTLSYIPGCNNNSIIGNLANLVLNQCDGAHWLKSEKKIPEWKNFDFGHNNKGSDWITSLVLTSLKRYRLFQ